MELIALPARKLGAAWVVGAMVGGVLLTLSGHWPLQVAGGLLMLASLASPLAQSSVRAARQPVRPEPPAKARQSGQETAAPPSPSSRARQEHPSQSSGKAATPPRS